MSADGIRTHRLSSIWAPLGLVSAVLLACAPAIGQTPPTEPVIRIEEDWELVLNEPDSLVEAPQFHTVMSPSDNLDSFHALVIWNYRELPEFAAGGLQLQSWLGEWRLRRRGVGEALLSTTAETITWTQALQTDGVQLLFEITNGHSETWGNFGKDMQIYEYAFLPDLNGYTTDISVENSWITYGSNRVDSLIIKRVRRYGSSGLISEDTTPKVVYERPDPIVDEGDVLVLPD